MVLHLSSSLDRHLYACYVSVCRAMCLILYVWNTVTFSHKRNKKLQGANLQYKRLFWPEEKRWVRMRISTKVLTWRASHQPALASH